MLACGFGVHDDHWLISCLSGHALREQTVTGQDAAMASSIGLHREQRCKHIASYLPNLAPQIPISETIVRTLNPTANGVTSTLLPNKPGCLWKPGQASCANF